MADNTELKHLRMAIGEIDRKIENLKAGKTELEKKITLILKQPKISDHAVIRYLERKMGFDFEDIRAKLLTPTVVAAMEMGAEGVKIDGGTLKIKEKTVVTFV